MRYPFLTLLFLTLLFSTSSFVWASSFYTIPIYPQCRIVDRNDSQHMPTASIVCVTSASENTIQNFYCKKLGTPVSKNRAAYRTVYDFEKEGKKVVVSIGQEPDGTEVTIIVEK